MNNIISVPDMRCEGCVKRINNTLTSGGFEFSISLADKTVTIIGDAEAIKKAIIEIEDLGFTPSII